MAKFIAVNLEYNGDNAVAYYAYFEGAPEHHDLHEARYTCPSLDDDEPLERWQFKQQQNDLANRLGLERWWVGGWA